MKPLIDPALDLYAAQHSSAVPPLLDEIERYTRAELDAPQMLVGRVEGLFLKQLVALSRARRVLEIGTFSGYSALMMASALPDDGELHTCELDPHHAEVASTHFAQSPVGARITLHQGKALDTLATLGGFFDLVFLDADKERYPQYLEALADKISVGGLLVADNVLWSGRVIDDADQDATTQGLRTFNDQLRDDGRFEVVMLGLRDGVTLARRLPA